MAKRLTWNIDCDGQSYKNKGISKQYGKANNMEKQTYNINKKDYLKSGGGEMSKTPTQRSKNSLMESMARITDNDLPLAIEHGGTETGTSIFDPVLCELMYKWFCVDNGKILDPFAGGSVRGIVANYLGYHYTGVDLRPEQIDANIEQAKDIIPNNIPNWICGNSLNVSELTKEKYDFVFSCPPYYDLEIYSDDPDDLSNYKSYEDFISDYNSIIKQSVDLLNDNRFACFVVGDIRDKKGFYRNFVSDTISAFEKAGAKLYNEAILVTALGSLPIRVGGQFVSGRKLGKTHQNILIFYKGNPKEIKNNFTEIEITCLDNPIPNN